MKAIIGLGNPTRKYLKTRHNIGFVIIDKIASKYQIALKRVPSVAWIGQGQIHSQPLILAKPLTYMNRSGKAINYLLSHFQLALQDLLVICDDVNLERGKIRIRRKGSAGGHKGLKSIIETLGTDEFPRLRIGIGKPEEPADLMDYVLSEFTLEEKPIIEQAILVAEEAVETIILYGLDRAMTEFNPACRRQV